MEQSEFHSEFGVGEHCIIFHLATRLTRAVRDSILAPLLPLLLQSNSKILIVAYISYFIPSQHILTKVVVWIMSREKLIPIRIDVTSDDESKLRIVDTLLLDRSVLPLPLERDRLEESLAENALYMAKSILGDAEVIGMGRTVRHFTGRMDLWSWDLVEKIHKCILDQLYAAFDDAAASEPLKKKSKTDEIEPRDAKDMNKQSDSKLIPIRIRMEIHGHRIHDDFLWDPSLGDTIDPLMLAASIGNDLNLPPEAIQELAIHIAEQMFGLTIPDDGPPEDAVTPIGPTTTAAWTLDQRSHQSNISHLAVVNATK